MPESLNSPESNLPLAQVTRKRKRNLAWVWMIPVVAALIGLSLVWNVWSKQGPKITILFKSASGLEIGKTQIRYRDVVIGMVTDIHLSGKRDAVIVVAELSKEAEGLAHSGTQFWVVKPRVGLGGISGLSTLLSGSYIEADTDDPLNEFINQRKFIGLETPPPIHSDRPGTRFKLRAKDIGSLGAGTPVFYRRIQVGMITEFELDDSGKFIDLQVFIDSPYDKFVNGSTRFWNESGIDVTIGSEGVNISTQSLTSILVGGVAFASFGRDREMPAEGLVFKLYDTYKAAEIEPQGIAIPITMRFDQSTRGLKPGASVVFQGVDLGIVNTVSLEFDPKTERFFTQVDATLYPERLGMLYTQRAMANKPLEAIAENLALLSMRGMRAQLRTANILTGQLSVTLADVPNAPKIKMPRAELPFVMPTAPVDDLDKLQQQVTSIMNKIDKIPFEEIGKEFNKTLKQLTALTATLDKSTAPELTASLKQLEKTLKSIDDLIAPGSPIPSNLDATLIELKSSVRALRTLADGLKAQPDSLITGRSSLPYSRESIGAGAK